MVKGTVPRPPLRGLRPLRYGLGWQPEFSVVQGNRIGPMTDIDVLKLWTIYKHPDDYPEGYVARQWIIADGGNHYAGVARYRPDLEAARAAIPPGLYRLDRDPNDDPKIVETWI